MGFERWSWKGSLGRGWAFDMVSLSFFVKAVGALCKQPGLMCRVQKTSTAGGRGVIQGENASQGCNNTNGLERVRTATVKSR